MHDMYEGQKWKTLRPLHLLGLLALSLAASSKIFVQPIIYRCFAPSQPREVQENAKAASAQPRYQDGKRHNFAIESFRP
jgi:hypothetical protein